MQTATHKQVTQELGQTRYEDPCVERGPTVVHDAQATGEAVKAVKEFLTTTFKLK